MDIVQRLDIKGWRFVVISSNIVQQSQAKASLVLADYASVFMLSIIHTCIALWYKKAFIWNHAKISELDQL